MARGGVRTDSLLVASRPRASATPTAHSTPSLIYELATARFVSQREDVLLLGPPGTGKNDWGKLLGDDAAVTALLDRLLHHARVLKCRPRNGRTGFEVSNEVYSQERRNVEARQAFQKCLDTETNEDAASRKDAEERLKTFK